MEPRWWRAGNDQMREIMEGMQRELREMRQQMAGPAHKRRTVCGGSCEG